MNKPNFKEFANSAKNGIQKHTPQILMGLGIAGMITTTMLAVKATPKALELIEDEKERKLQEVLASDAEKKEYPELTAVETVKVAWKPYIPAVVTGVISIGCLLGSNSVSARRATALTTAYKLSEAALHEYKDAVIETIGEKKEKEIREQVAEKRIEKNPVDNNTVIVAGGGEVLCYDSISGRYFRSSKTIIDNAINKVNNLLLIGDYISLNRFYDHLDLDHIELGDDLGWNVAKDGLIEIHFSSHVAKNGEPAIVLDYEVMPRYEYDRY